MPVTLLFVGDIHLGRVPERLRAAGLEPETLGPREAWRRLVQRAIDDRVDAVVLAGDVIDQDRDRFEAYGHLEEGVRRLAEADVQAFGVAGNHDGIALPRLAQRIPRFRLLGAGGRWERAPVGDGSVVELLGWSFPERHHRHSPLDAPGLKEALEDRGSGAACLGVLHADLDAGSSVYAPVSSAGLSGLGLDACFLGHVHQPSPLDGPRPLGYLGSLVGLDRGETGARGPWRVVVEGRGRVAVEQLQLGPVRWETVRIDASGVPDDDTADDWLHGALESRFRELAADDPAFDSAALEVVACSVTFEGRAGARRRVADFVQSRQPSDLGFGLGDQRWVVVKLRDDTRPAVDLEVLAEQRTPVGVLARLLIDLDAGRPGAPPLVDAVTGAAQPLGQGDWRLDPERWPVADTPSLLQDSVRRVLDELLTQRSAVEESR